MLYVYHGDRYMARELSKQVVASCRKKRPDAEYFVLSPPTSPRSLEELLHGQGLFETKHIVFCDEVLTDTVCANHLFAQLSAYVTSPHMFILFEPNLSTVAKRKLTKGGAVVQESKKKAERADTRRLFSFTDTLLKRDSTVSFTALHTLMRSGETPDAVVRIILWQLRVLAAVEHSGSAEEAGVKPFVYTKAVQANKTLAVSGISAYDLFLEAEEVVRKGRLGGFSDEEIAEYLVLVVG